MTRRKDRTIKDLYHVTEQILVPEMTPVLEGICRIQGPMDGTDGTEKKTNSSRPEKGFIRRTATGKVSMREESGTCNVCAAPCSSCRHLDQTVSSMEMKTESVFSDEVSTVNAATRCSFNDASIIPSFRKRARTDRKPTASESSNLLSASSSHDSVSENAESKAPLRTSVTKEEGGADVYDQFLSKPQGDMSQSVNVSSDCVDVAFDVGQKALESRNEVQNGSNGEDVSCVSGANDIPVPLKDHSVDADRRNVSCSTASVSSVFSEDFGKICHVKSEPEWLADSQFERTDHCGELRGANMLSEELRQKDHLKSSFDESLHQKSDPSEFPLSRDCVAEKGPHNLSPSFHSQSAKSVTCNAYSKDFGKNLCSQHPVESSAYSVQYLASSTENLEKASGVQCPDTHKNENVPELDNSKIGFIISSSPGTSMDDGIGAGTMEPSAKATEHSETTEQKSRVSLKVPSNEDPPSKFPSHDVSDGSDIVEDDVKVCDICGDAGREDLLAICSRCSDGAEHTYCMRIMMDKVPEGDWLCEVCQLKEEAVNKKKDKCETVLGTAKASSLTGKKRKSVATLDSKISRKSDSQLSDEEANKTTNIATGSRIKRLIDNQEVPSSAKRHVLESSAGSPKPLSSNKIQMLSKEMSLKNLDKGRVRPVHPVPSFGGSSSQDTACPSKTAVQNSSKIHLPLQSPRGTLSKSSSFNTSSLKPKVKMVQEDIPQSNKLGKNSSTSGSRKEGLVRTIGKSSSFNIGSLHSTSSESKAKVSSKLSRAEDLRGFKLGKERNMVERKNSLISGDLVSPRAGSNVSSPKDEPKVSSRGETRPLSSSTIKSRDLKAVQADVRLGTSKSTNLLPPRGSESPNTSAGFGDFKRQSSTVTRGEGYPSSNGYSVEQKPCQAKVEIAVNVSCTADGPGITSESMYQDKKDKEPFFNPSRKSVPAAGKSIRCNKCKEIGHAAQFCPNGSMHVSVPEAAAATSSREAMNRSTSTKSKDAYDDALPRDSGIRKKTALPDHSNEPFMSSTELICEMTPKDQLSNSSSFRGNLSSSGGAFDRQESCKNSGADSRSTAVTNVKHYALQPRGREASASTALDLNAVASSDGNKSRTSFSDMQNEDSAVSIPSRVLSIPEQEYIWQGGFDVQKNGRHLDSFGGIQAHLSTCASPKVLEVVKKLPHNLLFEEVSRSSTWPTQFQNCATEDNIALYFFAKDVESYIRSHQSLVENMMKNDLALKGILDGIELLIFPSNQLCGKFKRWNMLYFLWGVFRPKRANTSDKLDVLLKKLPAANLNVPLEDNFPSAMAVSRSDSSSGKVDKKLTTFGRSLDVHEANAALMRVPSSTSSGRVDTMIYKEESSSDQKCSGLETKSILGHNDVDSNSLLSIPTSNVQLCTDVKGNGTSMVGHEDHQSEKVMELGQCIQEAKEDICLTKGKTVLMDKSNCRGSRFPSPSPQWQETCFGSFKLYPDEASLLCQDACGMGSRVDVIFQENMEDHCRYAPRDNEKLQDEEGMVNADSVLENNQQSVLVENKHHNWVVNADRKRPHSTMVEMGPQASGESSACTSQLMPCKENTDGELVDGEHECKKMKRVHSETYSSDSSRGHISLTDGHSSQMLGLGSSYSVKERSEGAYDYTVVPGSLMTTERYFFPVDSGPIKDIAASGNSIPVQVISSDDEDQLESECPNLDLALGGEKKFPKQRSAPLYELFTKKNNEHGKCPEIMTSVAEGDPLDSLSLSLAVPLSSKRAQIVKPVAKPEPERSHLDKSLLLFGSFSGT